MLSPKEIQSKIRAGASVEQVAAASGSDISRIRRFAHPVLLERYRAAELATAAHPMLADGPAVMTLLETVTTAMVARGLDPDGLSWDAWRNEDNRWTVQLAWKVGRSDNLAHFFFTPGAHGGTVTAIDDAASELIDPDFERPLRPLARVAHVEFEEPAEPAAAPPPREQPVHSRRGKPVIPAWEDVLLGRALRRTALPASDSVSASSASHAPVTPTPAPSTNHRSTGVRRHPHRVGANPPAATMLSPTANSGCTRTSPRLSTTIAAPVTAATKPATVKPVAQGTDWVRWPSLSLTRRA